jgi:hypothetical protein
LLSPTARTARSDKGFAADQAQPKHQTILDHGTPNPALKANKRIENSTAQVKLDFGLRPTSIQFPPQKP